MKRKILIKILLLIGLAGLTACSEASADAAGNALRVCALSVVPSLFPFFVLSKLLLSGGFSVPVLGRFAEKCFGVSAPCLSAFFVSILGGYPAGAAAVTDLYKNGEITKQDAERALCFCNNSGPALFLSFIGGKILGSIEQGLLLYLIHVLSAVLCGRLFSVGIGSTVQIRKMKSMRTEQGKTLTEAISESCVALLQISGLIVFFSVMLAVVEEIGLFRLIGRIPFLPVAEAKALLCGIFELSGGILCSANARFGFVLCAFLTGWGGFCVHMQTRALWQQVALRPKRYLCAKLLHGLISALFALACMRPGALSLSVCAAVLLFCLFFPAISKNKGRNIAQNAL